MLIAPDFPIRFEHGQEAFFCASSVCFGIEAKQVFNQLLSRAAQLEGSNLRAWGSSENVNLNTLTCCIAIAEAYANKGYRLSETLICISLPMCVEACLKIP